MATIADELRQKRQPAGVPTSGLSAASVLRKPAPSTASTVSSIIQSTSPSTAPTEKPAKPTPPSLNPENLRIVVRQLPPTLDSESFFAQISSWVNINTADEKYFVKGRESKKRNKEVIMSRCYIKMKDQEGLKRFYTAFESLILDIYEGMLSKTVSKTD